MRSILYILSSIAKRDESITLTSPIFIYKNADKYSALKMLKEW